MGDEQTPRPEGKLPKDITSILKGWDYEAGTINVRKVPGSDGQPKLQMRLDLGLLQMELSGRPDGRHPHGCESLLDYFEGQLADHKRRHGTEIGFQLTANQCELLREEAVQYYQRYLSLFVLEEFPGVVRDTARDRSEEPHAAIVDLQHGDGARTHSTFGIVSRQHRGAQRFEPIPQVVLVGGICGLYLIGIIFRHGVLG